MAENEDRDAADHLKASVEEAIGKLTGDSRTEAEGRLQKRDAESKGGAETRAR